MAGELRRILKTYLFITFLIALIFGFIAGIFTANNNIRQITLGENVEMVSPERVGF